MGEVTSRLPFYDLRDWWLSDQRVQELIVDPRTSITSGGLDLSNPFFPVAQQPEGGFPYIRYTTARDVAFPQWWMQTEQIGLELFMVGINDSSEVLNKFISMAARGDDSARDLELWLRNEGRAVDFAYHSIQYIGGGDISATNEEGGAHSRIMMFNILYSPLDGMGIA